MGIGAIGSIVSLGASLLPKITAPLAKVAKAVGGDSFVGNLAAGALNAVGGKSDSGDAMKKMTEKFIFDSLAKMRDDAAAKMKEAAKKGDPGAV